MARQLSPEEVDIAEASRRSSVRARRGRSGLSGPWHAGGVRDARTGFDSGLGGRRGAGRAPTARGVGRRRPNRLLRAHPAAKRPRAGVAAGRRVATPSLAGRGLTAEPLARRMVVGHGAGLQFGRCDPAEVGGCGPAPSGPPASRCSDDLGDRFDVAAEVSRGQPGRQDPAECIQAGVAAGDERCRRRGFVRVGSSRRRGGGGGGAGATTCRGGGWARLRKQSIRPRWCPTDLRLRRPGRGSACWRHLRRWPVVGERLEPLLRLGLGRVPPAARRSQGEGVETSNVDDGSDRAAAAHGATEPGARSADCPHEVMVGVASETPGAGTDATGQVRAEAIHGLGCHGLRGHGLGIHGG